jgi:hypothetical protein
MILTQQQAHVNRGKRGIGGPDAPIGGLPAAEPGGSLGGWKGCLAQIEADSGQEDIPAVFQQNSAGLASGNQQVIGPFEPDIPDPQASERFGQEEAQRSRSSRTLKGRLSGQPDSGIDMARRRGPGPSSAAPALGLGSG